MVYLEAGSGAISSVPKEMVRLVSSSVKMPVIVGGGINDPETAGDLVKAGAAFIVTGNYFEKNGNSHKLKEFAQAVHFRSAEGVIV